MNTAKKYRDRKHDRQVNKYVGENEKFQNIFKRKPEGVELPWG